jgi:hypothetical protein
MMATQVMITPFDHASEKHAESGLETSGNNRGERPGAFTQECLNLYGMAMDAMLKRARTETPFSPDLKQGFDAMLRAAATVNASVLHTAHCQLQVADETTRSGWDDTLRAIGARDMLNASISVSQLPDGNDAAAATDIVFDTNARDIPWLGIVKEILKKLIEFVPIPGTSKDLIKCVLRLICKFLEGTEQPQS